MPTLRRLFVYCPICYESVLSYANEFDVFLWGKFSKSCFFDSLDGHANIKEFIETENS